MKKIALIGLLCSGLANADSQVLEESLNAWQPLSIKQSGSKLSVVLNENRVTDVIYDAVVQNGICMPLWLGRGKEYLQEVRTIDVLNKYEKQGYVFIEPLSSCEAIGKVSSKSSKVLVMGNSRIF
jgi:hypothetical protein